MIILAKLLIFLRQEMLCLAVFSKAKRFAFDAFYHLLKESVKRVGWK